MAGDSGVNPFQMDFWDGMDSVFWMPSIDPTERKAVWDAVAGCVQRELSLHKGIRIPTLGSFDVVHTETLVGSKAVILQRPVFHLARNLGGAQTLENKDDLAGGKQLEPLKYAKVAVEASVSRRKAKCCILGTTSLLHHCLQKGVSVAFVLRDVGVLLMGGSTVQMRFYLDFLEKVSGERIQDSATLKALQQLDMVMSRALPIPSLSFTGRVIIFPNFEQPFLPTSPPRDHLKDLGFVPGEDDGNKMDLSPIREGVEGRLPALSIPAHQGSTAKAGEQPQDEEGMEMKPSSRVRKLPAIPGDAAGGKQPVTERAKGKAVPKGQESKQGDKEAAAATQRGRGGRGERKDALGREGERKVQLGKGERRQSLGGERENKGYLGREGERRDSFGREEERTDSWGKEGERRDSLSREGKRRDSLNREGKRRDPLRKEGERRDSLSREGKRRDSLSREGKRRDSFRKEGERRDSLSREGKRRDSLSREGKGRDSLRKEGEKRDSLSREGKGRDSLSRKGKRRDSLRREGGDSLRKEGEKKVGRGREKKSKDAAGNKGEKAVQPKRGESKVSPGRKGEKEVPLRRAEKNVPLGRTEKKVPLGRAEKEVPLGREGAKFHLKSQEVKYLLGREREKFHLKSKEAEYLLRREGVKKLPPGREAESKAPLGSSSVPWGAQARGAQDPKAFVLQQPGAEAPQALRARPEVFWSVLKEPQKSVLAGYRFESSRLLPPLSLQAALASQLEKRDTVSRGPWPWVE